jgi:MFS family permease
MLIAACCFGGGFLISALGVWLHQIWLLYAGYGVLGGIGLGLGYVAPVATLIRWFPDRRGLATGLAIMGFGGGAMIGAPLASELMSFFKNDTSVGVAQTFVVMGVIYFISMTIGSLAIRIPPPDWKPEGWAPPAHAHKMVTRHHVHADQALRTPQFWLLWLVLCLYVTTGLGIIGQASLMIQEMFKGAITAAAAAGFVGLLSLFNMGGRLGWSSASDYLGRRKTYFILCLLGAVLYAVVPYTAKIGSVVLFVVCVALILSMYGGAFAAIPAYIADVFGTLHVGGIHGRMLTAWSAAGILGPALVNYVREFQVERGVSKTDAYNLTLYIMAVLLLAAFVCNLMMHPVHEKYHLRHTEVDEDLAEHEEAEEDLDLTSDEEPALAHGGAAGRVP